MDKSPLKTLTLEDFLESERHKLTGTLTPVTPESFEKWKKERLDKKAAEEQARQAKEATGRAMFEKGGWENSEEEGDSMDEDEDAGADDGWNMEEMRRETERLREEKEQERLRGVNDIFNAGEESSRSSAARNRGDEDDPGDSGNPFNSHNDDVDDG